MAAAAVVDQPVIMAAAATAAQVAAIQASAQAVVVVVPTAAAMGNRTFQTARWTVTVATIASVLEGVLTCRARSRSRLTEAVALAGPLEMVGNEMARTVQANLFGHQPLMEKWRASAAEVAAVQAHPTVPAMVASTAVEAVVTRA
jgi:hypothetical protein